MKFSIIDVETTGLSPRQGDRVLEIGIVRLDENGEISDRIDTLINPEIPVQATHIHGITDEMTADAPTFGDIASTLLKELSGTVIVAHNASFDTGFLLAEFRRAGYKKISMNALCTLILARRHFPFLTSRSLASCRRHLGISDDGAHNALADARATAVLLHHFLNSFDLAVNTPAFHPPENFLETPMLFDDEPHFKTRSDYP